ncbi:lmo0937 family membrane protein [Chryseobacterium sp. cx-311]|uniref:lmo0937 family membrane protein n=1 Tax=Weeksellaceae TaxID=2762318 RepID=UPI0012A9662C|nr:MULTISPECIES: lmo0937 family membrane protein [Weeksellaceae]MBP0612342.1 lmo0937 family membrane protein [Marnyiella aurantia]MDF0719948.1 lmo0937 family membrane protein [Kaistella sp. PBT33-4]QFG52587.1 lmo0937 family membrane protein [Chryseobacterium sp.]
MKDNILYIMAAVLFFSWMIGYMLFDIGGVFHFMFLFSVLAVLLKLVKDYSR